MNTQNYTAKDAIKDMLPDQNPLKKSPIRSPIDKIGVRYVIENIRMSKGMNANGTKRNYRELTK